MTSARLPAAALALAFFTTTSFSAHTQEASQRSPSSRPLTIVNVASHGGEHSSRHAAGIETVTRRDLSFVVPDAIAALNSNETDEFAEDDLLTNLAMRA